jgi:hypothetical protein
MIPLSVYDMFRNVKSIKTGTKLVTNGDQRREQRLTINTLKGNLGDRNILRVDLRNFCITLQIY